MHILQCWAIARQKMPGASFNAKKDYAMQVWSDHHPGHTFDEFDKAQRELSSELGKRGGSRKGKQTKFKFEGDKQ
jgi:hypothetical protein